MQHSTIAINPDVAEQIFTFPTSTAIGNPTTNLSLPPRWTWFSEDRDSNLSSFRMIAYPLDPTYTRTIHLEMGPNTQVESRMRLTRASCQRGEPVVLAAAHFEAVSQKQGCKMGQYRTTFKVSRIRWRCPCLHGVRPVRKNTR